MSDSEGFLAPSLAASIAYIRKDFAPWFDTATRFNALGMRLMPNAKAGTTDNQQLVAAALYGRVLTSFQAANILAERGMLGDARTVVRAAAETAIFLAAVAKDEAVCDLLIDRHFWHHRKLRNAWLNDPEAVAQMTSEQVEAIKATIANADTEYPRAKTLSGDPVSIAALAQSAGATGLYNAIYRSTSGDAAHTSIDALNRHIRADSEANVVGLKFGPDVTDLAATLSDAMSVVGHALHIVIELFKLHDFREELAQCVAAWKALGMPADYRP
jgi:hypothetical protein